MLLGNLVQRLPVIAGGRGHRFLSGSRAASTAHGKRVRRERREVFCRGHAAWPSARRRFGPKRQGGCLFFKPAHSAASFTWLETAQPASLGIWSQGKQRETLSPLHTFCFRPSFKRLLIFALFAGPCPPKHWPLTVWRAPFWAASLPEMGVASIGSPPGTEGSPPPRRGAPRPCSSHSPGPRT